ALRSGLSGVVEWAETIETYSSFAEGLPFIGDSMGEITSLSQLIQTEIADALNGLPTEPTPAQIEEALEMKLGAGTVDVFVGDGEGRFDIAATLTASPTMVDLDFGPIAQGVALADGAEVPITGEVDLNFSFGIFRADGLAPSERFFVKLKTDDPANPTGFRVGVSIDHDNFQFGGKVGFLSVNVGDNTAASTLELTAAVAISLAGPDPSDGAVTLAELLGNSLASLVPPSNVSATGSLSASIPVSASVGSFSGSATFTASDADLFDTT